MDKFQKFKNWQENIFWTKKILQKIKKFIKIL